MKSFEQSLQDAFRGKKVRVVSQDEAVYEGFVKNIDFQYRHFILYGATRDGEELGPVVVSHAERAEVIGEEQNVQLLSVQDVSRSPYCTKTFDREENLEYIAEVHDKGVLWNFPTVRPVEGGYEIVDGHKGLWVCEQAGLDKQPVLIQELSDWQALEKFVFDHFPLPHHIEDEEESADGYYTGEELRESLERVLEEWGEPALDIPGIEYNAERLGVEPSRGYRP